MTQADFYAQSFGLIAQNHLDMLSEALIGHSNGTGTCPVSTVETLTRVALESLSRQSWLSNPTIDIRTRYRRLLCLEVLSARAGWTMLHDREDHAKNPDLRAVCSDADFHQIPQDPKGEWVGVRPDESKEVELVGQLLSRFSEHVTGDLSHEDGYRFGRLMYRQLSGGVHSNVNHVMGSLVDSGEMTKDGQPIATYGLTRPLLWQCIVALMLATFTAQYDYAAFRGLSVPEETRRLHLHHISLAREQFHEVMRR
jgi:hypothetical protein